MIPGGGDDRPIASRDLFKIAGIVAAAAVPAAGSGFYVNAGKIGDMSERLAVLEQQIRENSSRLDRGLPMSSEMERRFDQLERELDRIRGRSQTGKPTAVPPWLDPPA